MSKKDNRIRAAYEVAGTSECAIRLQAMHEIERAGRRFERNIRQYREDYEASVANIERWRKDAERMTRETLSKELTGIDAS